MERKIEFRSECADHGGAGFVCGGGEGIGGIAVGARQSVAQAVNSGIFAKA